MQSFFETQLSEKMKHVKGKDWRIRHRNWSRWKEEQKDTVDLNSFYNFYEMELSKKTNRLAAQKDHENYKVNFNAAL